MLTAFLVTANGINTRTDHEASHAAVSNQQAPNPSVIEAQSSANNNGPTFTSGDWLEPCKEILKIYFSETVRMTEGCNKKNSFEMETF